MADSIIERRMREIAREEMAKATGVFVPKGEKRRTSSQALTREQAGQSVRQMTEWVEGRVKSPDRH